MVTPLPWRATVYTITYTMYIHVHTYKYYLFYLELLEAEKSSKGSTGSDQIGILEEGAPSLIETTVDSIQDHRDAQPLDNFEQRLEISEVLEHETSKFTGVVPNKSELLSKTVEITLPVEKSINCERSSSEIDIEEPEIPMMSPVLTKDISHVTSSGNNQSKTSAGSRENISDVMANSNKSTSDSLSHTTLGSLNSTLAPPTLNLNALSPKITHKVLTTSYLDPIVSIIDIVYSS